MSIVLDGTAGVTTPAASVVGATTLGSIPTVIAVPSMVRLHTGNGYGSTNNKIHRYLTTVTNQGSDITYADSATLGATFTINTNGVYAITKVFSGSVDSNSGISLNSSELSTDISSLTNVADRLVINRSSVFACTMAWTGYLSATSMIRSHGDGATDSGSANRSVFTIVRVA
jgi:hypothetical protein